MQRAVKAALVAAVSLVCVGAAAAVVSDGGGVINACAKTENGQLRLVDAEGSCHPSEESLSWNETGADGAPGEDGAPGADGQSVTSQALPVGNAHCTQGGSSFTSVSGTTYACNGAPGAAGGGSGGSLNGSTSPPVPFVSVSKADGEKDVGSFTVPAGTAYLSFTGRATVIGGGFDGSLYPGVTLNCRLADPTLPSTSLADATVGVGASSSTQPSAILSLAMDAWTSSTGSVHLYCRIVSPEGSAVVFGRLTAITSS